MKSAETLKIALSKYKEELQQIRDILHDARVWARASVIEKHDNLLIAQEKEKDDLLKQEAEFDFRVRFVEWVLENDKPKVKNDDE